MMRAVALRGLLLLLCSSLAASEPDSAIAKLEALHWLTGSWGGPAPKGSWESRYSSASGGLLLGVSKQIVEGRVVSFEFERFEVQDGEVVMIPYPNGKRSPVKFTLTQLDIEARRAIFENPEHDFPQIITYERVSEKAVRVLVQARDEEGRTTGFDLNLTVVDCPGSPDP
jgi:hypothetical protein